MSVTQVDMVSPVTQTQLTFPVGLDRLTAREELWWLNIACSTLETRLLQASVNAGFKVQGLGWGQHSLCASCNVAGLWPSSCPA